MGSLSPSRLFAWLLLAAAWPAFATAEVTDNQVEAVFLFNFAHFVAWPAPEGAATTPFDIGVLGNEQMGTRLDQTVHGESVDGRPMAALHSHRIEDLTDCQILFIDHTQDSQLRRIISDLEHRSVLTVSDIPGSAEQGVMIQFVVENNRVRLRINVQAAEAAGLTLSSKLLRAAEIVTPAKED